MNSTNAGLQPDSKGEFVVDGMFTEAFEGTDKASEVIPQVSPTIQALLNMSQPIIVKPDRTPGILVSGESGYDRGESGRTRTPSRRRGNVPTTPGESGSDGGESGTRQRIRPSIPNRGESGHDRGES